MFTQVSQKVQGFHDFFFFGVCHPPYRVTHDSWIHDMYPLVCFRKALSWISVRPSFWTASSVQKQIKIILNSMEKFNLFAKTFLFLCAPPHITGTDSELRAHTDCDITQKSHISQWSFSSFPLSFSFPCWTSEKFFSGIYFHSHKLPLFSDS